MLSKIVIIGAGITGLTTAYYLSKLKAGEIHVFEKKYLNFGASTRNAGHFRVHFGYDGNILFSRKSREMLINLAKELGWNSVFDIGGYLWLLYKDEHIKLFEDHNKKWKKLGIAGKLMDLKEVKKRYPYLNLEGYKAAFFGPQDGKIHHDAVSFGYYYGAMRRGVKFHLYSEVSEILIRDNTVVGVKVGEKTFDADTVVVAAGIWTRDLLKKIDVDIPLEPLRKEICVTEPMKYFIKSFIIDTKTSAYIAQTLRGEGIGSIGLPKKPGVTNLNNTARWSVNWAKAISRIIPALRTIRYLRVWSGHYNVTPDYSHTVGRVDDWPEGLYVNTGYSGHGFMMAPYAGYLLAKYIASEELPEPLKPFSPERFKRGELIKETLIVG